MSGILCLSCHGCSAFLDVVMTAQSKPTMKSELQIVEEGLDSLRTYGSVSIALTVSSRFRVDPAEPPHRLLPE
jgi:hypothetical protein